MCSCGLIYACVSRAVSALQYAIYMKGVHPFTTDNTDVCTHECVIEDIIIYMHIEYVSKTFLCADPIVSQVL